MRFIQEDFYGRDYLDKEDSKRAHERRKRGRKSGPVHVTVRGLLTPSGWTDDGTPDELTVSTDGEVDYIIEKGPQFERMARHCPAFIQVSGKVRDADNRSVLTVSRFEIFNH